MSEDKSDCDKLMDLSIIIVNYKATQLVLDCLKSVYDQTVTTTFEILLVDNNSEDDCLQVVKNKYPEVITLQMGYNAGFARANNAAIKQATGENILLLNSDTIIQDQALDKTVHLFKNDEAIACGVQLLNTDGSHQISGAHFVVGGMNFLLPLPYLGRFVRWLGYTLKTKVPSISTVQSRTEVDWIVGAFLMVKRNVLTKTGLLDEDFFMYAEEIEWCSRIRKHGKLVLYAEPQVIHLGGGTSGDFYDTDESENGKNLWNKKGRQVMLSMFVRIRKQYGMLWFLIMLGLFVIEIPIFFFGVILETLLSKNPKFDLKNFVNYCDNLEEVFRHFFKIAGNKPYFYKGTN